jgi:hypothetical protein
VNTDLLRLVAAAADLCRRPLRHAVRDAGEAPGPDAEGATGFLPSDLDRCLRLEVRSAAGERLPHEDLELEIYRSGDDLHLTLAWLAWEERPMLWQGSHPVWMDGSSGRRCERPEDGAPLEALARRLRALLVPAQAEG